MGSLPFYDPPRTEGGHKIKFPLYHFLLNAPRDKESEAELPRKIDGRVREYWTRFAEETQSGGERDIFEYPLDSSKSLAAHLSAVAQASVDNGCMLAKSRSISRGLFSTTSTAIMLPYTELRTRLSVQLKREKKRV